MKTNTYTFPLTKQTQLYTIQDFFNVMIPSKKYQHLLIQNKWITIDQQAVKRETFLIGHSLEICLYPITHTYQKKDCDIPVILYEDAYVIAVSKPAGIIVHHDGSDQITLCDMLAQYYLKQHYTCALQPLHRLDCDTSGIVLFSKSEIFQPLFDNMMSQKLIKRNYLAFVSGKWNCHHQEITLPIGKDRHQNKQRVSKNGQFAKTIVSTKYIDQHNRYSMMHCSLETGRTHQIRVHCSYLHHPLLADRLYGSASSLIDRVALHAYELVLFHPILQKEIIIHDSLPNDLKHLLPKNEELRK